MAIDIESEQLVTFAKLTRKLPARRKNRPIHSSTIHRWRSRGIRGIRLEAARVGGAWHTTFAAFARYCETLTRLEGEADARVTAAGDSARRREIEKELGRDGW